MVTNPYSTAARDTFSGLLFLLTTVQLAYCQDWPQWNGPTRDGVVHESGLLKTIPADGLKLAWRRPVGLGYSGPTIADGKVFLFDYEKTSGDVINNPGTRDKLTGNERLTCLDAANGKTLWTYQYDRPYAVSFGGGPRATPTYHKGLIYLVGAEGDLTCLTAKSGKKLWHLNFNSQYKAKTPIWGHSASPLVYADSLICMVGGKGSLVVGFDLKTGQEKWKSLSCRETGYCPPTILKHASRDQLLIWDPDQISSLNPSDGKVYWQHPLKPDYDMSILPPIKDGNLLFTGGEGSKSVMLKLKPDSLGAELAWTGSSKKGLFLATGNGIFYKGHLYGADIRSGALICAKGETGERLWQTALPTTGSKRGRGDAHGTAFLMQLSGDQFLLFSETGDVISAELTPDRYQETGRFHAIEPTSKTMGRKVVWTYPALAGGKLFLRNDKEIVAYEFSESIQ